MATFKSTEYTNATDGTGGKNQPSTKGKVWSKYSQFTGQALSSSDVVQVMTIPLGAGTSLAADTFDFHVQYVGV